MTTRYRYDGLRVTRSGLGARGVDVTEVVRPSGASVSFPLYDAHGNNVATLSRSGSSYAVADRRSYDAWGVIRAQQSGGDPKLRYCANLGHRQDDESGLVYMRARYYEPTSGRFLSEDPSRQGGNWFSYCSSDPVNSSDASGKAGAPNVLLQTFLIAMIGTFFASVGDYLAQCGYGDAKDPFSPLAAGGAALKAGAASWLVAKIFLMFGEDGITSSFNKLTANVGFSLTAGLGLAMGALFGSESGKIMAELWSMGVDAYDTSMDAIAHGN